MGQILKISNSQYENFISADEIIDLTLIESIGNLLPMFSCTFSDTDFKKLEYLNELNPITIGYQLAGQMVTNEFVIKPKSPSITTQNFTCAIGGYLNKFEYFKGIPKVPYVVGTSIEAISQLAGAYFITAIEDITTDDSMNWLYNGKIARNFIQDIWKHVYTPNDLVLIGIDLSGTFRLASLNTLISQEPKYRFSNADEEGYQLYVQAETLDGASGTTSMYGYTSQRDILLESNLQVVKSEATPQVIMNTANQMNEMEMPVRNLAPMFQSTNVHAHWYEAYHQNFVKWSSINNNAVQFSVYNNLLPLNIMDLIYIKFPQVQGIGGNTDGNFIISHKEIHFDNLGNVTTDFIGIREVSQNISKGATTQDDEMRTYKV